MFSGTGLEYLQSQISHLVSLYPTVSIPKCSTTKRITFSLQNIFSEGEGCVLFTVWHGCVFSHDWKAGKNSLLKNLPLNIKTKHSPMDTQITELPILSVIGTI